MKTRLVYGSLVGAALLAALTTLHGDVAGAASAPTAVAIYQSPLTVAIPAHPQVMIAVGNSESMDGDLLGAIRTGSGSLGAGLAELQNSSSPVNFTVPAGFTPPVSGGAAGTQQAYTLMSGGNQTDNSPSRLNIAKQALGTVIGNFMANTDFALMDYSVNGLSKYTTWVYYMSPPGGFTVVDALAINQRGVLNPCFGVSLTGASTVSQACNGMSGQIPGINLHQWLVVAASSDDPNINDVLYASGVVPLCMVFGGPDRPTPYPPNFSLNDYNNGTVLIRYNNGQAGGTCATATGPTNAGYVPYTPQVMYVERGWGYYTTSENAATGNLLVPMTSAGSAPTTASVNTAVANFTPFLKPETNSGGTTEIKASGTQAPTAGLLARSLSYFQNSNPASSNGCTPTRYVVLVTDGLPTLDLAGRAWPPLGTVSAAGYGVTATWNGDGSLNTTNDQAFIDTINGLTALNQAGIKTYIIGVGAGVNNGANLQAAAALTAMAIAGGTTNYYAATDPTTLANALQNILASIQAGTQSVATAAVNSTSIHAGSVVYQGQFSTSDDAQDWSGDLLAFPVDANTGDVNTALSNAQWSAQAQLDLLATNSRVIATWDPVANAGTPFRWTTGTPTTGIASSTALGTALSGSAWDSSGADALSYLRGNQTLAYNNGGPYRARAHVLGDIVDSAPLYVGAPSGTYTSASYATFAASVASRTPTVYVGSNDGMLHAFRASDGRELFAYIPRGVYSNLLGLTDRYYAGNHHFYVDGSPSAGDVYYGGSWHTLLVGGEGAGGNSIYALDVTHPESLSTEAALSAAVLWDFTDGNMGLTFSRPVTLNTNAGAIVAFGNGYNSAAQTPFFYALNAQTGAALAKIDLCAQVTGACNTSLANGLSSVTAANTNGDLSSPATLIYAGDLQGNVWRIDISSATPGSWRVSLLFQARASSSTVQPITSAPAVSLNPRYPRLLGEMVYVATGQMLGVGDLSTTQTQSVYGIYDDNSMSTVTRSQLVQQTQYNTTITLSAGGTASGRTLSNNAVTLPTKRGWYVDLTLMSGERVVTDPQVDSGALIITSVQPGGNLCAGGDYSWLNLFNYATGGAFSSAQLSLTTQVIAGVSLGQTFAAAPRVQIFAHGAVSRAILVTESGTGAAISGNGMVPIQDFQMYGRARRRAAWTEMH